MMASRPMLPRSGPGSGTPWPRRSQRTWTRQARRRWSPEALLGLIPSLPRPVLARLTTRMIDRMDQLDGDPDLEPEPDAEDGHDAEAEDAHD